MAPGTLTFLGFDMLKARPHEDAGQRIVYCEPSNEAWDTEDERILAKALLDSRPVYLERGNIDIEHLTLLGYQLGVENPRQYEIGLPVEVREGPRRVFLKGRIYTRNEKADWWWQTVTQQDPPMRWFPSVAGANDEVRTIFDTASGTHRRIVTKCRWVNTGFARESVNQSVPAVSLTPIGSFVKAVRYALSQPECDGDPRHCECVHETMTKAITAGYGTDSAALTGGGALRRQSIQGGVIDPWERRASRYLKALGTTACDHTGRRGRITLDTLREHFVKCEAMTHEDAAHSALRLVQHVANRRRQRAAA